MTESKYINKKKVKIYGSQVDRFGEPQQDS